MLKLRGHTKVYIFCSAGAVTGGPEALHQLCHKINEQGGCAYMVYVDYGTQKRIASAKTPPRYRHYAIKVSTDVEDTVDHVVVMPEIWPHLLDEFSQVQKCLWWLSVDYGAQVFRGSFSDTAILHLYQSAYAREFLTQRGAARRFPLYDYLSVLSLSEQVGKKEPFVLYNPGKGLEQTERIIASCEGLGLQFVPLRGFSRSELSQWMTRAMFYIDFGGHPGKDRIPREAASYHLIVITSRTGSAGNQEDIPIPEKYKIHNEQIEQVGDLFKSVMSNWESSWYDLAHYRRVIRNQEREFSMQVSILFCRDQPTWIRRSLSRVRMTSLRRLYWDFYERSHVFLRDLLRPWLKRK